MPPSFYQMDLENWNTHGKPDSLPLTMSIHAHQAFRFSVGISEHWRCIHCLINYLLLSILRTLPSVGDAFTTSVGIVSFTWTCNNQANYRGIWIFGVMKPRFQNHVFITFGDMSVSIPPILLLDTSHCRYCNWRKERGKEVFNLPIYELLGDNTEVKEGMCDQQQNGRFPSLIYLPELLKGENSAPCDGAHKDTT